MLSKISKPLLIGTGISPVLITYAWVAFWADEPTIGVLLLIGCIALVLICVKILSYAKRHLERIEFKVVSIEAADRENIAFLLLYLLPLFTEQFGNLNWNVWIPAIVIFGLVVATGYSYHFNPLLGLMGWHFYKVGTGEGVYYVLVTKKQLRNAAEKLEVGQLTEYIVIDLKGK